MSKRFAILAMLCIFSVVMLAACGNIVVVTATPALSTTVVPTATLVSNPKTVVAFQYPTEKSTSTPAPTAPLLAAATPKATFTPIAPTLTPLPPATSTVVPTIAPPHPTQAPAKPATQYNIGSSDSLVITIKAVDHPTAISFFKPDAGKKFVALTLDFKLQSGASSADVNSFYLKGYGDDATTYTIDASSFGVTGALQATTLTSTIPEVKGVIVFQLPNGVTLAALEYQSFTDNIQIPLKF